MTMVSGFRRGYQLLTTAVEWLTVVLTLMLVVIVSTNVFFRYVLSGSLPWAEELSRLTFVWVVFLGAYVALRKGAHLAVTGLVDRLPSFPRGLVIVAGHVLVAVFLVTLIVSSSDLISRSITFGTRSPVLQISIAWSYLPLVISAALMLLHVIDRSIKDTRSLLRHGDSDGGTEVPAT